MKCQKQILHNQEDLHFEATKLEEKINNDNISRYLWGVKKSIEGAHHSPDENHFIVLKIYLFVELSKQILCFSCKMQGRVG